MIGIATSDLDKPRNVYAIQSASHERLIKVGSTTGLVATRMKALQAACPYQLEWIAAWPGTGRDEEAAHEALAGHRFRGEWYYPTPGVLAFLQSKSPDFCRTAYLNREHSSAEAREITLLTAYRRDNIRRRIAAELGMDIFTFQAWRVGRRIIPIEQARRALEIARRLVLEAA